ncbi:MAG: plasmid partitioning protein RepB [Pseudomonadota bacterium]
MARKNLLQGLMDDGAKDTRTPPAPKPEKRALKGAIGAVSQSIEALKARSLLDLDPFEIDAGGLQDRLESDDAEDAALLASLRDYGQQVPVMVRPHPDAEGRYQIVYGRRRVLAMRDLGQSVKALVRDLDDSALVMAQGQENTARRNLSFIEKANFAAQMRDAGYERKAMCDALSIDKTVVSRMLAIVDRVGADLIQLIGAAPSVGRDRWVQLSTLIETNDLDIGSLADIVHIQGAHLDSNDRFDATLKAAHQSGENAGSDLIPVSKKAKTGPTQRHIVTSSSTGAVIASVQTNLEKTTLTFPRDSNGGFEKWLTDNLDQIHRDWVQRDPTDE